ncbi:PH domain-containing protein [Nitrososphaera sp.]|uniref:PH domain-containing protein n=1 Tax=Nitrososphaera sp. TaxID=1971748 RepID=UPI002EDB2BD0
MTTQEIDPEVKSMFMPNEEVLLIASQGRGLPGGSITTPDKIYVTNMRVLYKDPKLFGLKARINDIAYRDISNIELKRGVFSTEIQLIVRFNSKPEKLPAVDKQTAQQLNMLIQKGIRGELPRQIMTAEKNAPVQAKEPSDPLKELERLGELKQKGLITEEEFQRLKVELLKRF